MPVGISLAPELLPTVMGNLLKGLAGVFCLISEVLVYGKTVAEHWARSHNLLERVKQAGMTVKKEKCELGCYEVKFLGHVFSSRGVKPDSAKGGAI